VKARLPWRGVTAAEILDELNSLPLGNAALVIVREENIDAVRVGFPTAHVTCVSALDVLRLPGNFEHLVWATEEIDVGARTARLFYSTGRRVTPVRKTGPAQIRDHNPLIREVLQREYELQHVEGIQKFGYGPGADFENLCQVLAATRHLAGSYLEVGTYFGSSACVALAFMEEIRLQREAYFIDTFSGFDYPEAHESPDWTWAGSHRCDGEAKVRLRLEARVNKPDIVHVIQANILHPGALSQVKAPIAVANIDVDLKEAVDASVRAVWPLLAPGGVMIVEDAGHTPWLLGARVALEDAAEVIFPQPLLRLQLESGQYLLIKPN